MRTLTLETSTPLAGLCLLDGDQPLLCRRLPTDVRTAQALTPTIRDALREVGWSPQDLQLIGVTIGPGSFTGLRIGVTAAKTMAYALKASLVGIDTLDVLATQAVEADPAEVSSEPIWAVIDALRGELFVARFERRENAVVRQGEIELLAHDAWLEKVEAGARVIGDGLRRVQDRLPEGVRAAEPEDWVPDPRVLGRLALARHASGATDDPWRLAPAYHRRSAAEEKAAKRSADA